MRRRKAWLVALVFLCLAYSYGLAKVIECSPVSSADRALYDRWGARQLPAIRLHSCAPKCRQGLRLCLFTRLDKRPGNRLAVCNGRDHGAPCQLYRR
jgi:hypothetical protein